MKELARELRIGNLLYSTRKIPFTVTLEDLAQIEEGSQAEAIPLTEEWLKLAGFEESGYFWFKGLIRIWMDGIEGPPYFTEPVGEGDSLEIKSVHQLQNYFFARTGQELKFPPVTKAP